MVTEAVIWAIFLLPLGSFAFAALVVRPFFNRYSLISGLVTIAALGTALGFSIWTLRSVILGHELVVEPIEWLEVGGATIEFGLLIDPLTAVMLIVVTSVSLLVQIYSLGYMKGDPSFSRYYAYMSLFTAAMLGLVCGSVLLITRILRTGRYDWRAWVITAMLLLVAMFGAWVATGEGGAYNQGCSVGFWRGWPLCHGELIPISQMGNSPVDVQFGHRLVVLVALAVLVVHTINGGFRVVDHDDVLRAEAEIGIHDIALTSQGNSFA